MEFKTRDAACYERGSGARSCRNSRVRGRLDTCNTVFASYKRKNICDTAMWCLRSSKLSAKLRMCCVLSSRTKIRILQMICDLGSLVSAHVEKILPRVSWSECCAENLHVENIMRK